MIRVLVPFLWILCSQTEFGDFANTLNVPVYLDNVLMTVNPTVYGAIGSSVFLREEFSAVAVDTITANDDSSIGTYVSGAHTYVEFFCSSGPDNPRSSGFGFSVERGGGVAAVAAAFSEVWGDVVQTGLFSGPPMPRYYTVSVDKAVGPDATLRIQRVTRACRGVIAIRMRLLRPPNTSAVNTLLAPHHSYC